MRLGEMNAARIAKSARHSANAAPRRPNFLRFSKYDASLSMYSFKKPAPLDSAFARSDYTLATRIAIKTGTIHDSE